MDDTHGDALLARPSPWPLDAAPAPPANNPDPDTCRICRGEATPQEPLFYPCKCSGSIKYVHQDCLMEWLSHSQKKHCELCKTSFRFTKLYSPNMPKQLPFFVFARHLARYFVRNVLVWLRVLLVVQVWMVLLPALTRWEWSFFFWVSEEGLLPTQLAVADASRNATAAASTAAAAAASAAAATNSLLNGTSAARAHAAAQADLYGLLEGNGTTPFSLLAAGVSALLEAFGTPELLWLLAPDNGTEEEYFAGPHTLLSDVTFLRRFSRFRWLNKWLIYVMEGQFITLLVVVCFILIILVRDYVLQQQPEINLRPAFNAGDDDLDANDNNVPRLPAPGARPGHDRHNHHHHHHHHHHHPHGNDARPRLDDRPDDDSDSDDSEWETDSAPDVENPPYQLPRLGLEFGPVYDHDHDHGPPVPDTPDTAAADAGQGSSRSTGRDEVGESSSANATSRGPGEGGATVHEYMSIYRRAGGDQQRILEIAREEGLEEHLQYWLRVMQSVAERRQSDRGSAASGVSTVTAEPSESGAPLSRSSSKGKRPADTPDDNADESATHPSPTPEFEYGLRPRANTDGPSGPPRTNPLANNSWSFGPVVGAAADRVDGIASLGQSSSVQGTTEPSAGELRRRPTHPNDVRRKPLSGLATLRRGSSSSSMAGIDEEVDDSAVPPEPQNDSSTPGSAAVPTPPSISSGPNEELSGGEGEWEDVPEVDDDAGSERAAANRRDEVPQAPAPTPAAAAHDGPDGAGHDFFGDLANFMWRDLDNIDPADLPPIPADEEDEDHVGLFNEDEDGPEPMDEQDREAFEAAAAAAAAANLEAEAIEDAEDLEGVMELLGMRGPLIGLFQNVVFCGFLVTVSLLVGIFMPYNFGRLSIWLAANPMRPVMLLFTLSRVLQDMVASGLGGAAYGALYALHNAASLAQLLVGRAVPYFEYLAPSMGAAWDVCATSAARVMDNFDIGPPFLSTGEIRNFSAISHEALLLLKSHAAAVLTRVGRALALVLTGEFLFRLGEALELARAGAAMAWHGLRALPTVLAHPGSWVITLDAADQVAVQPELAFWGGIDRSLAILSGYAAMCLVAGIYLHNRAGSFAAGGGGGGGGLEWEAPLIEGLQQAGGVLKVILIIGIEMLVFPLYCGLLLDVALLPLFENTTLLSRLYFSIDYPLTSMFVHWFVGTGYMFHFALFVSMCRKIMRKGVLYFIRDPDDPEFHPVRDVLERSVATQLRKILFSAFVYGALVIICLGGVVWGLAYAGPGILPIHYSSNEPVLEFPIDLLFYNFLMPLAIRFFRPSDGLHAMYTWWFRKSARGLRITWFLFGDRRIDEEGVLVLAPTSPHRQAPWAARQLLTYDVARGQVVPVALRDHGQATATRKARRAHGEGTIAVDPNAAVQYLRHGGHGDAARRPDMALLSRTKRHLVDSGQLRPDGRFVRAPASDQVKIDKGKTVFLDVTDAGTLMRELEDKPLGPGPHHQNGAAVAAPAPAPAGIAAGQEPGALDDYHGKKYELVYIPPHFRVRVFLFIASIWLFAAVTGVAFTILPLLFGRRLFRLLLPAGVRTNDIYAFSIGIYVLGSASYFVFHARGLLVRATAALRRRLAATTARGVGAATLRVARRAAQLAYAYFFLLVVFPLLATALVELYALIPLHTYMYPPGSDAADRAGAASRHTVRIIQAWTLGLLYLKVGARAVTSWYPETRLASAIRAVLRRGNLDPDVRLLTRAFVVPGLVLGAAAIGVPLLVARGLVAVAAAASAGGGGGGGGSSTAVVPLLLQFFLPATVPPPTVADPRLVYRLSFPLVALAGMALWMLWGMVGVYATWKLRIRDEVYLIGERLHNFGATAALPAGARRTMHTAGRA